MDRPSRAPPQDQAGAVLENVGVAPRRQQGSGLAHGDDPTEVDAYDPGVLALLLVAVSVGLDNFGAASALGVAGVGNRFRLRIALVFGAFEAAMPVIGILLGRTAVGGFGSHAALASGAILCAAGAYACCGRAVTARRPRAQSAGSRACDACSCWVRRSASTTWPSASPSGLAT